MPVLCCSLTMISFLAKHLTLTSTILRFERHLGTGHWDTELPSLMQWLWESCNWASSYGHTLILLHKWPFFIFFPSNIFPHLLLDIICLWWGYPDINHQSPCRNLTNPSKGKEYQPIRGRVRSAITSQAEKTNFIWQTANIQQILWSENNCLSTEAEGSNGR